MPAGFLRALRVLHHTFHHHPPGQRLHILGRFLSAPFLRTLDAIPAGARVLDIGAGHGALARLLVEDRASAVVAVEPDLRKTLLAFRHPKVQFVAGFDDCIRGRFDAVTLYDVMYRIPVDQRDALVRGAYERLKPGGVFIVKELDPSARWKRAWSRLQETISDRLLGLTIGEGFHLDTRAEMEGRFGRAGFSRFEWRRVDFGYPHPHILYVGVK